MRWPTLTPDTAKPPRRYASLASRPNNMAALIRALEGLVTCRGDIGVVMTKGMGGLVHEHQLKFDGYRRAGTEVELRGPCYSACTLITAYLGKDKLCIAPDAFMAFHAAPRKCTGDSRRKSAVGSTSMADTRTCR